MVIRCKYHSKGFLQTFELKKLNQGLAGYGRNVKYHVNTTLSIRLIYEAITLVHTEISNE